MGSITARALLDRISQALNDEGAAVRSWLEAYHLASINEGQRWIASLRQDAVTFRDKMKLAAGTVQSLPAGAVRLIKVESNLGLDGFTPGDVINLVDQEFLDAVSPDWRSADADAAVSQYLYDNADPTHFEVDPPQPASGQGYVRLLYVQAVTNATVASLDGVNTNNPDSALTLQDSYYEPLFAFCMHKAYLKEGRDTLDPGKAAEWMKAVERLLGLKSQADAGFSPHRGALRIAGT